MDYQKENRNNNHVEIKEVDVSAIISPVAHIVNHLITKTGPTNQLKFIKNSDELDRFLNPEFIDSFISNKEKKYILKRSKRFKVILIWESIFGKKIKKGPKDILDYAKKKFSRDEYYRLQKTLLEEI